METTDFTAMNREEIRYHLTSAIGDDYLYGDTLEELVLEFEEKDDVTPDEFWSTVENVLG